MHFWIITILEWVDTILSNARTGLVIIEIKAESLILFHSFQHLWLLLLLHNIYRRAIVRTEVDYLIVNQMSHSIIPVFEIRVNQVYRIPIAIRR